MRTLDRNLQSISVFGAFVIALFLVFTPFEAGGSMLPKHFAAGVSVAVLTPFLLSKTMRLKLPSLYVFLIGTVITIHTLILRATPGHFTVLIVASFTAAVLLYELSLKWEEEFERALAVLLVVNIVIIVLQFLLHRFNTFAIFDFHRLIFDSPSRFSEEYLNIPRFSGLHVEPGTYANYIACLLGVFILVARRTRHKNLIVIAGLLSILLTNSAASVPFVLVVAAIHFLLHRDDINKPAMLLLAILMLAYFFHSGLFEHLQLRFKGREDGSLSLRMIGINSYLALSGEDKFIGIGFDLDPCRDCHYQDIGVLFNLFTRGGVLIALTCSLLFLRMARQNGILFFLLAMSLLAGEKMFVYEAPVWLFVLYAMSPIRATSHTRPISALGQTPVAPWTVTG